MKPTLFFKIAAIAITASLAACGGGGDSKPVTVAPTPPAPPAPTPEPPPPLLASSVHAAKCVAPRTGIDQATAKPYPDVQGTLADEKSFLRSWIDEDYLWYREVPTTLNPNNYATAIDYFNVLKSPLLTASGKPKDNFHFTYSTEEWRKLQSQGVTLGYGITWSRIASSAPRTWYASMVEPASPAAAAGVRRGDRLVTVDGIDFANATGVENVNGLNAGLFPTASGEMHSFGFARPDGSSHVVQIAAGNVASTPVQNTTVIDTPTGKVGYLTFNSHNAVAERQLFDAFTRLQQENVTDLVLDLRYNGGGLLYMAGQLGYMIAGPAQSTGKAFERMLRNDKRQALDPVPFVDKTLGFPTPNMLRAGTPLPWLGLKRVTVITTASTCSASESIINGLRGIDVEVNLIGARTCGKPYGFLPKDNCGTTYFAIDLQGANDKGFGDYAEGFPATCTVPDDLTKQLGDPAEGMLAAALRYRDKGQCDSTTARARTLPLELVRHPVHEVGILGL